MSPEQMAQFQAKLAQDSGDDFVRGPSAPVDDGGTAPSRFAEKLYGQVLPNAEHFATGPAARALTGVMNPTAGMLNTATDRALTASGVGRRNPVDFQRELEGAPQHVDLQPMATGPAPEVPTSPTLASMGRPSSASVGGMFGGAPFGGGMGGLAGALRQAHANQIGTFDRQKDLVEERGALQGDRINREADMQELVAARQLRDAEVQKQHDQQAMQKHEAFLARNEQLATDIGAQKIDPQKVIGDMSAGTKIGYILAGVLSGAVGQGQQVLQRLNDQVEQGVRAQMANVDNKKAALGARQNLFSQMMAESGDRRVAEAQTRNLIYESIKQDVAAKAARLGIPEVENNARILASDIQAKQQDPLLTQIATENLQNAKRAADAAATAQRASEDRAFAHAMQVGELGVKVEAQNLERRKFEAENGGDQGGLGKAGKQAMALEQAKAQQELVGHVAALKKTDMGAVTAGTNAGHLAATTLPGWVPGVSGAMKNDDAREAYNRQGMIAVGAAYKIGTDATEPKRKEMLEHFFAPYKVDPGTPDDVAETRRANLVKLLEDNAAAKGAAPPAMPDSVKKR